MLPEVDAEVTAILETVEQTTEELEAAILKKPSEPLGYLISTLRHELPWPKVLPVWLGLRPPYEPVYRNPRYNRAAIVADGKISTKMYCVHGTMDHPLAYNYLVKQLISDLPAHIESVTLVAFKDTSGKNTIEMFADNLVAKIKEDSAQQVILMGHSRGGLIATQAALKIKNESQIGLEAVIPIAAPFKGSQSIRFVPHAILRFLAKTLEEMTPAHKSQHDLQQKINETADFPCYPISATSDSLVSTMSGQPDGLPIENRVIFTGHNHLSIRLSPGVANHIRSILDKTGQINPENANLKKAVFVDIERHILLLKRKLHWNSPVPKIQILTKIKMLLENAPSFNGQYPIPETIRKELQALLSDTNISENLNLGTRKPIDILRANIDLLPKPNYETPVSLFALRLAGITKHEKSNKKGDLKIEKNSILRNILKGFYIAFLHTGHALYRMLRAPIALAVSFTAMVLLIPNILVGLIRSAFAKRFKLSFFFPSVLSNFILGAHLGWKASLKAHAIELGFASLLALSVIGGGGSLLIAPLIGTLMSAIASGSLIALGIGTAILARLPKDAEGSAPLYEAESSANKVIDSLHEPDAVEQVLSQYQKVARYDITRMANAVGVHFFEDQVAKIDAPRSRAVI